MEPSLFNAVVLIYLRLPCLISFSIVFSTLMLAAENKRVAVLPASQTPTGMRNESIDIRRLSLSSGGCRTRGKHPNQPTTEEKNPPNFANTQPTTYDVLHTAFLYVITVRLFFLFLCSSPFCFLVLPRKMAFPFICISIIFCCFV